MKKISVAEAFDSTRKKFGEVKFSKTSLNDPHIKKILDEVKTFLDAGTGLADTVIWGSYQELLDKIQERLDKIDKIATKSPILYDTIKMNIVESEVFKLLEELPIADSLAPNAPKLSVRVVNSLIDKIMVENSDFFPLRDAITSQYLHRPNIIFVPSDKREYKQYNDIETAAATEHGDFIFSVPFMQNLLTYAHIKGLKPKGQKYVSNGGEFPDEYAYIEFLIIHEFLHYTYADFHYRRKLKANMKIINWVGDFRSNYLLVKSGFEQLPIGLYSDHVNYDRQTSFKEMYKIVKAEFDKLKDDEKEQVEEEMEKGGDEHLPPDDGDDGDEGAPGGKGGQSGDEEGEGTGGGGEGGDDDDEEGEPGEGGDEEGDGKGKGDEEGEPGDGKKGGGKGGKEGKDGQKGAGGGKPGKAGKPGKGGNGADDPADIDKIFDEIDKNHSKIEEKLKGRDENASVPSNTDVGTSGKINKGWGKAGGGGSGAGKDQDPSKFDFTKLEPTFSWQQILSKLVTDATNKTDESYHKLHRRSITGVHLAKQTGSAAIKPGEIPLEDEAKLAFVVDSSGSMSGIIDLVYANMYKLMKSKNKINKSDFFLIKFSADWHVYKCNFSGNSYKKISSVNDTNKSQMKQGSVKDLFSEHFGSMTNFTPGMVEEIKQLSKKNYNTLVISDSDVVDGANFENLKNLITKNKNVFVILDCKESFVAMCQKLGQKAQNVTYFK